MNVEQTTEYRVTEDPQNDSGSHWDTMRPPAEHLREEIETMRAMDELLRQEEGPSARAEQILEDTGRTLDDFDVYEILDEGLLEVQRAHWTPQDDREDKPLARLVLVTGTGGPHVEIVVDMNQQGRAERVTLNRYWSGRSCAWTDDDRALDIATDYVEAFFNY